MIFPGTGGVVIRVGDLVNPFLWGGLVRLLFTDPISNHRIFIGGGRVPRNTVNDEFSVDPVCGLKAHPEVSEILPFVLV